MAMTAEQRALLLASSSTAATTLTTGTSAGGAAVSALVGAAGGSLAVPVAGWVAAGGMLAAAGVIGIVKAFRSKGRRAALAYAESLGFGGKAFAHEYAKMASKPASKVMARAMKLKKKIEKKARKGREKRVSTLVDRFNADRVILLGADKAPHEPAIMDEPETAPVAAGLNMTEYSLLFLGIALALGTYLVLQDNRHDR